MFSGKSEEMIRRLRRAEIAGQRVRIFKPWIDDRYDAADVVSHAGVRMSAVPVDGCAELVARARGCEVVGIDEVQFFEPTIIDAALALADGGARVIAAGLDQDFRRRPELEEAFLAGYGCDPREPEGWRRHSVREAIGTAVWSHKVGATDFEAQGHRMIADLLADPS